IADMSAYRLELAARRDPTAGRMNMIFGKLKNNPQRVIFAEGEDERVIRAATQWRDNGYGEPLLVGRVEKIHAAMARMGIKNTKDFEIINASLVDNLEELIDHAYKRLQRKGFLRRDCARVVKNDRNVFSATLLATGRGDALITGATRNYNVCVQDIRRIIPDKRNHLVFGLTIMIAKGRTVFLSDTTLHELPSAEELSHIAIK